MIRGCRRRMVIVSGSKDSSFETAYFVLKDSAVEKSVGDDDVMKMANSLIESCYAETRSGGKNKENKDGSAHKGGWFFGGFFAGIAICVIMTLVLFG